MSLPADGGLELGEVEVPAGVQVDVDRIPTPSSKLGVIERFVDGEPPTVKVEVFGDGWGSVDVVISIEDAKRFRDRLEEVINVAEEEAERRSGTAAE